ncbi:glycosyltransferase family 39 protein [Pseudomonas sp. A-RE-19]|uniref:glycosyltransferase family 39 protein n=1 Tax=Pseudomonas sp. A-RE-19 TaxID=2832401 RepID=UPI001CBA6CE8|nr:glycosyltransferase family 39 protein [Pseudomonas sp. A-RE-19]
MILPTNVPSRVADTAGLVAVVAIALFARFHAITVPVIWYDEAYSLLLAEGSPAYIWATTARDVHPPLYYVLLHFWMLLFGNGVLAARSLSALADVGTLLLCIKLMSLVTTRKATWIAALLLALLPISVRYSQEVRMYTLLGFWLMGATVALVCWVKAPDQKRYPILYVLLMTAAFYTHYFAALCVLVHWLFCWRVSNVRGSVLPVRAWIVANGAIVVLYLPWLPDFIDQLLRMDGLEWIPPLTWPTALTFVWQLVMMGDSASYSFLWRALPWVMIVVCAAAVLLKARHERPFSVLLVGYFFVPVLSVFLVSLIVPVFNARYLVFAAAALPLIVALALDAWSQRHAALAAVAMVFVLLAEAHGLSAVYAQTDEMNGTSIRKDARLDAVVAGLGREVRPGDEIIVDNLYWYLPFTYYNSTGIQPRLYAFKTPTGTLWGTAEYGGWALIPRPLDSILFDDFSTLKLNAKRIWWVTGNARPEHDALFPKQWKPVLTLKEGDSEARLFILEPTPELAPNRIIRRGEW